MGSESIDVAILNNATSKRPVGGGVLVDDGFILTCAHVVRESKPANTASASRDGGSESGVSIAVRIGQEIKFARLTEAPWLGLDSPDFPSESPLRQLDFFILKLDEATSMPREAFRIMKSGTSTDVRIWGYPHDRDDGVETRAKSTTQNDARGLRQLNSIKDQVIIREGFSGAAVRDESGHVLGIVVTRWFAPTGGNNEALYTKDEAKLAYMIPIEHIARVVGNAVDGFTLPVKPSLFDDYPGAEELLVKADSNLRLIRNTNRPRKIIFPIRLLVFEGVPASNYPHLEQVHFSSGLVDKKETNPATLVGKTKELLFLQAPGGSGKSFFLSSLIRLAVDHEIPPYLLELKHRRVTQTKKGPDVDKHFGDEVEGKKRFLESHVSSHSFESLEEDKKRRCIILIDGFNESVISPSVLVSIIERIKRDYPKASLVVTDRLTKRDYYPDSFKLATLAPVAKDEIDPLLDSKSSDIYTKFDKSTKKILQVPFFLDLFLSDPKEFTGGTKVAMLDQYVDLCTGTIDQSVDVTEGLRELAYLGFVDDGGLEISIETFEKVCDAYPSIREYENELAACGLISQSQEGAVAHEFRHHLVQDALAANYLSTRENLWDSRKFNDLSLRRSSPESLFFVAELLAVSQNSDRKLLNNFVIKLYDWDYPIAIQCMLHIGGLESASKAMVYSEVERAIFCLVAEKKFDLFLHTRTKWDQVAETVQARLTSALGGFPDSHQDLTSKVKDAMAPNDSLPSELAWYPKWYKIFTATPGTEDLVLLSLFGIDPILGWTASNRLHRERLTSDQIVGLRSSYLALRHSLGATDNHTVRWRILHGLAGTPTEEVADFINTVVWDGNEHMDPRHGAARSLVEVGYNASDEKLRREIFEGIESRLHDLNESKAIDDANVSEYARVLEPFRKCSIIESKKAKEPEWWHNTYSPILSAGEALFAQIDKKEAKLWRDQHEQFKKPNRQVSL